MKIFVQVQKKNVTRLTQVWFEIKLQKKSPNAVVVETIETPETVLEELEVEQITP